MTMVCTKCGKAIPIGTMYGPKGHFGTCAGKKRS